MASSDAKPVPQKNVAYRITFPILDADGDLVTGATGLDSEVSKDAGTFADCTNEATEIATSSGVYYLDLTSTEMNADTVAIIVKTTSVGAKTTTVVLYPEEAGDIRVNVTAYGGTAGTFASGRPEVNVSHWLGTAAATPTVAGVPEVDVTHLLGTAWLSPGTAGTPDVNVRLISGDSAAADNAESFFDGTGYAGTNNVIPTVTTTGTATNVTTVNGLAANVITAASIATGAIDADAIADNAIDAGAIATGAITAAKFAAGAIDAAAIANAAIDAATFAADVDAEILSYLVDDATRIDASALNTASVTSIPAILADTGTDGVALSGAALTAIWDYGNIDGFTHAGALSSIYFDTTAVHDGLVLASGTIGSTGNSTTALHLTGLTYGDDEINDCLIVITDDSTGERHARWIADWADTGDLATVATLPFTPENAVDTYVILPVRRDVTGSGGLDAAGVRAALGMASADLDTQLDAIKADTGAILTDTGTTLQGELDNIEADVDTLLSRLGTPSDLGGGATVAANLSDIEAQTDDIGAAGAGLTALATAAELAKVPKSDSNVTWNATALASIQTEANDALVANNLDHLVLNAVDTNFATTVHLDSVIGHLADAGTTATFDRTTDSLEANRDNIGTAGAGLTAADDAVISAIGALNNITAASVWAVGTRTLTSLSGLTVDTVTTLTNLPTIPANWITAAGIADGAIDTATFASGATLPRVTLVDTTTTNTDMRGTDNAALAATALSTATWTGTLATNLGTTNSTVATNLDAAVSSRSTLTQTQVTGGAYSIQSSSCVLGDARIANLDAAVTTRMATYTQPTGFLAATFPGTVASPTNITAGTIANVTNPVTTTDTANVTAILADTNELQTDWANGGRLDLILDARASQTSVDDIPTNAELATALGTADDATLAAIAALNNLSAAQVNAEVDTALADYDGPTNAEMVARTLATADYATATALQTVDTVVDAILVDTAEIGAAGAGLTALGDTRLANLDAAISTRSTLTQAQVTGGAYSLNSASFAFNAALDFTTTQKAATLARVTLVDTTTTNTDMRGTDNAALAATALSTATWTGTLATNLGTTNSTVATNLDAAVSSRSTYAGGAVASVTGNVGGNVAGSVGSVLGGINTTSGTITTLDALDTAQDTQHSTTQTAIADVPTNAELTTALGTADDAVLAAIATLQTYVDTEVAAIKAKTDNLPAAPAATGDIPTVSQIWTTALVEAYRSVGAAGTPAQLLHEIIAHLGDSSISGTTKTINNRAGSAAKTYTLNSASSPTAIAEAS